jgi:hypothetical protein
LGDFTKRLIAAAAAGALLFGATGVCAQEVLLAKPQMTTASRQADIKDCRAIYDGKPRDPAMMAELPTDADAPRPVYGAIYVPAPSGPAPTGYSTGMAIGVGLVAVAMMDQMEWEKALDRCMRLKGYVVARLTRKELAEFRELLPIDQDGYIDTLIRSGRLAEAARPLVARLPEAPGKGFWRIVPGSVRLEPQPGKRKETLATAKAVFSQEARLKEALVVEPGKLEIPAGATFFGSGRLEPDLKVTEPAWCTLLGAAAGRDEGAVLCLVYGNDGYQVFVVKPQDAAPLVGKPRIEALPTAVDLVLLEAPATAPASVTYAVANNTDWSESLVGTAAFADEKLAVDTYLVNASPGVDRTRKGKVPSPDIDAGPVALVIGEQAVTVSALGKGGGRLFEIRLDGSASP